MRQPALSILLFTVSLFPLLAQKSIPASEHFLATSALSKSAGVSDSRDPETIAREYIATLAAELGLATKDLPSLFVVKNYRSSNNGVRHLLFHQQFDGYEVSGSAWAVNIDADGRVLNAGGRLYAAPEQATMPSSANAAKAVRAAVSAVNSKVGERFDPVVNGAPLRSTKGHRFAKGMLAEDPEGIQVWTPAEGKLKAGWRFEIVDTDGVGRFLITLADADRQVTTKTPLTLYQKAPAGMVFERGTPQPYNYGTRLTVPPPYVDRTMQSFAGNPTASPRGWVAQTETSGNNIIAGENLAGTRFLTTPKTAVATNGIFNFPLQLGPGAPNPIGFPDASTTNLFYWMNIAHDLHYQSGFDEAAGNYQTDNFGRGGLGGDPVYVYSHFGAQTASFGQFDNAYFSTRGPNDGSLSMVAMFMAGPNATDDVRNVFTEGTYDATVMIHEYTHGVSFRLVDGGYNTFQGASMGEAWSDFFGLEYTLPPNSPLDGFYPTGEYFFQSWGLGSVRTRPYSTDMSINSLTFADMGKVLYYPEVHSDGEIWFEALWEARANLIKQFGDQEGRRRIRQIVIDGMKLCVPNPTMVDARDAILLADRVDFNGASQSQLWTGFAKRGLGALAYSDGGNTVHVVSSFELPSNKGAIKFYDAPIVFGESTRVVVSDANYTATTMLVQFTTSGGDLENVILKRHGNVFVGSVPTGAAGNLAKQDGGLSLVPGDQISAYYVDYDTGAGGGELVSATIDTMPAYALFGVAPAPPTNLTFDNEKQLARSSRGIYLSQGSTLALPFQFPYFTKKYGSITVQPNGLITFDHTYGEISTPCTDPNQLLLVNGIAPLWMNIEVNGSAQKNEGIFYSGTEKSFTVRWAAESYSLFGDGVPINFAVTLYDDGRILTQYATPFTGLGDAYTVSGCGSAPTIGISNGHDIFRQFYVINNGDTAAFRYDPPFNFSSIPVLTMTTPTANQSVQDLLSISGRVTDSAASISRVDILIDGVQKSRATISGEIISATLNLPGLGILPGNHTLSLRVTNTRGAFSDFPANSTLPFTMTAGTTAAPTVAIESPKAGDTISGILTVTGYALDETLRISRMDLMVDGFVYAPISYGLVRAEICANLNSKSANCPRVGFGLALNTLNTVPPMPDGPHGLQVRVFDSTGRITVYPDTPVSITVNNGKAAPIVGAVTAPSPNDRVSGTITVSGWGYSEGRKITSATLVVDGSSIAAATYGVASSDVCAGLTNVAACPNIGFTATFDTRRLVNGRHRLGVLLRNDRGDAYLVPAITSTGMVISVEN